MCALNEVKGMKLKMKEIKGIKCIDFIDVFPTSVEHKMQLDLEMQNISSLILETERGNVYILHEAIHTKFGELKFVKIRFFDETRLNWEAAIDFVVEDRNILLNRVGKDSRYSYIQRPEWDAVEFKTSDTLIYFLHPLASEVYSRDKK